MSNSRIFCIAFFVASGLLAAGANRGFIPDTPKESMAFLTVYFACFAVAFFGDRGK